MSQSPYSRRLFAIGYILLATSLIYLAFSHWAYDDPFITYRYAQNLAAGKGFVYNPGERILSTTTPLFALILAAGVKAWSDLPHLANLLGAFSLALGGWFLWDLGQTWKQPWVGWAGLLLYPTSPLVVGTLGSETPLYLAFCLGTFAFYARRNYTLAAALAALAVLTRPDGILVAAILALDYLLRVRRRLDVTAPAPWMAVLVFCAICVPWFVFAWSYFGSPLPVTLLAKQHQGSMAISERFAPGLLTILKPYTQHWYFWVEAGLAIIGIIWMFWRARIWGLILSWTALYFLTYTALGVSRYFWYYAPLTPGFIAAVGLGIAVLDALILTALERFENQRGKAISLKWAAILPISLLLALTAGKLAHLGQARAQADPRIAAYRAVGEWLKTNTPATARVGALEIGAIGYYSERPVIDFAGLIQPEVTGQLRPETTYADAAQWAIERFRPEYLALHAGIFPELEQGFVAQNCQLVKTIPGEPYHYKLDMNIYQCNDL
jgi:hypothetical protein